MNQTVSNSLDKLTKFNLGPIYILSYLLAMGVLAASLAGIFYTNVIYPSEELLVAYMPSDVVNLVIGLPFLLLSMIYARRGSLMGLLGWTAALFFTLYNYAIYLFGIPHGVMFLAYLGIAGLSLYALIGLVAGINKKVISERLHARAPARLSAGVILFLGIFIAARVVGLSLQAIGSGEQVSQSELGLWIADVLVGSGSMLIGGVLLWMRKPFGYLAGPVMLLQYVLLALGLVPVLIVQAYLTGTPVDVAGIVVVLIMASICLIPYLLFARAARPALEHI